jgi:hypothetical protein
MHESKVRKKGERARRDDEVKGRSKDRDGLPRAAEKTEGVPVPRVCPHGHRQHRHHYGLAGAADFEPSWHDDGRLDNRLPGPLLSRPAQTA